MRLWALIVSIAVIFGASPAHTAGWRASGSGFYLMGTRHIMTSLHVVAEAGDTQSLGGFSQRRVAVLEFQNISVAVSRGLFAQILGLIWRLRPFTHPT